MRQYKFRISDCIPAMIIFAADIDAAKRDAWREIVNKPLNQRGGWLHWDDFKHNVKVEEV